MANGKRVIQAPQVPQRWSESSQSRRIEVHELGATSSTFSSKLPYSTLVQGTGVATGIGKVFLKRPGEVVCAGEVLFCTHIEVVVLYWIEHRIKSGDAGDADGSGR